jgi:L-alanine-DL-glutamate epimerase-like enolase superfamily enzyme
VVGDESCTTPSEVSDAVLDGRSSMVSIKTARTAILGSSRIRDFCQTVGVEVLTGSQGETGLGTLAAGAFTASSEWSARVPGELLYFLDFEHDLLTEPPRIADGRLHLSELPGFGAEIDEVRLQHAALGPSLRLRF